MKSILGTDTFPIRVGVGAITFFTIPRIARGASHIGSFKDLVEVFIDLLSSTIPVLFGLALLLFFWGVARSVLNTADEEAMREGRKMMVYGVIALFVIFSIWGILALIGRTLFPFIPLEIF